MAGQGLGDQYAQYGQPQFNRAHSSNASQQMQ